MLTNHLTISKQFQVQTTVCQSVQTAVCQSIETQDKISFIIQPYMSQMDSNCSLDSYLQYAT